MTTDELRMCVTCGEPLPPRSGRGRPRITHAGECSRARKNAVEEERKERIYRDAVAVAASDLTPAESVAADLDDEASMPDRLHAAGFGTIGGRDPDAPAWEQPRAQHRSQVLDSLTRDPEPQSAPADIPVPQCWDCPLLRHVEGVRAVFTTATLAALIAAGKCASEDRQLRERLDEVPALMAALP